MKDLVTGKNKEQFEIFILNNSYLRSNPLGYKITYQHLVKYPFEMQIGVLLAYYDSLEIDVYVFKHHKGNYTFHINKGSYYDYSNSRDKSYKEAFIKANEIVNNNLK